MKKVTLFSFLLILGLVLSQSIPFLDTDVKKLLDIAIENVALVVLAFIMIHIGMEFTIDKRNVKQYGWDYFVAFTAASLPWLFCALYFVYFFQHTQGASRFGIWTEALLLAKFAAPTSAGVLFTMMAAARLEGTWVFKKGRILAIFDDLNTILLHVPLKMLIVGFKWEAATLLSIVGALIYLAWKKMRSLRWPINWKWVLGYSLLITAICEGLYFTSAYIQDVSTIQLEILLPCFVFGCMLAHPDKQKGIHKFFEKSAEKRAKFFLGGVFIFLAGLSLPPINIEQQGRALSESNVSLWNYKIGALGLDAILLHVLVITVLSNLGKMYPLFCYRKEAEWKERLALCLSMCPRGEVGAGIIVLALSLLKTIDKSLVVIAMLSLGLNLALTGPLIVLIKRLLRKKSDEPSIKFQ